MKSLFPKVSFRKKQLILLLSLITFSVVLFTLVTIWYVERNTRKMIDETLLSVAYGAHMLVGDDYHDKIENEHSITPEEYDRTRKDLRDFASQVSAKEVYSYVFYNNELKWTSGVLDNEEFFSGYPVAEEKMIDIYYKPLEEGKIQHVNYEDTYGSVRSVFIPFTSPSGKKYVVGADYDYDEVEQMLWGIVLIFALMGIVILLVAYMLGYILFRRVSAPLTRIAGFANELIKNDYELSPNSRQYLYDVSQMQKGELGVLSETFLRLQSSLKQYIHNLKETTAAKENLESQLQVASSIQMGMLPKEYQGFPEHKEFDICGYMKPAREVGGDLYNFFMIDDEHLGFTIGDVSDKGVPAALFMAMTNTLVKAIATGGYSPADVLYRLNNSLCSENEQGMFVTLFLGKLNIKTGLLQYANAGHNPFILFTANDISYQKLKPGIVLAAFENFVFINEEIQLNSGDKLLMYTDGVTEAMNAALALYGEPKLLETTIAHSPDSVHDLVAAVMHDVEQHAAGYEQSDDITILALHIT